MTRTIQIKNVVSFAVGAVTMLLATLLVTTAWRADAAPGDDDSTFVPTAGCRLTDTRVPPDQVGPRSAPLGPGDIYEITVHGSNGECTGALAIPTDAVGVALNVTAVNATSSSNIRLYPANLTEVPLLSNLNVSAGAPPTPNKVDVQLSPDGKIKVYNFRGTVDVILDVVGYYTKASLQELANRVAALEARDTELEAAIMELEDTTLPGFDDRIQLLEDAADAAPQLRYAIVETGIPPTLVAGAGLGPGGVSRAAPGNYRVDLGTDFDQCAAVASPGRLDEANIGIADGRSITLNRTAAGNDLVFLRTWDANGNDIDSDFMIIAVCPPPGP